MGWLVQRVGSSRRLWSHGSCARPRPTPTAPPAGSLGSWWCLISLATVSFVSLATEPPSLFLLPWSALRLRVICWARGEWSELVLRLPRVCPSGGGRDGADVRQLQVHRLRLVLGTRNGLKVNEIAPNRRQPWKPGRGGGSWSVGFYLSGCLEPLRTGVQGSPAHCCPVCFHRTDH